MTLLIGADPELFIRHSKTKMPMSIIGRLGGTKNEARWISKGHGVLEDNCAAEFNIPPAKECAAFIKSIRHCISFIGQEAEKHGAEVFDAASVEMPVEELENPAAWEFGCEPDYNAYTGDKNLKPSADNPTLRSAGGHVHVGFKKNPTEAEQNNVGRWMDMYVGLCSTVLDPDKKRKLLYGKAGAIRYKPYGVEYRTPSNFWIWDDKLISLVFNNTKLAVNMASKSVLVPESDLCMHIQHVINTADVKGALDIMGKHNVPMEI